MSGIFSINRALHFSKIFYFDSLKVNNAPKYRLSKDYMNCGLMILVYKLKSLNTCCILHSSLSSGNPTIKKEACQLFFMGDFAVIYRRILSLSFPPYFSSVILALYLKESTYPDSNVSTNRLKNRSWWNKIM